MAKISAASAFLILFLVPVSRSLNPRECRPEAMSRCTDPLKVVTDNKDLGFATSREELDRMCPKLMDGLRCIDEFTYRCLDVEHRNYFNTLYQGTTQVIVDLCQRGQYQSDYLQHAPCMRRVQAGYEQCADTYQVQIKMLNENAATQRRADIAATSLANGGNDNDADQESAHPAATGESQSENENVQLLCCSFQQYLHCSERIVNSTCGYETARFTKSFLDRMSGPLIQGHCLAYEHGSSACDGLAVNPEKSWSHSGDNSAWPNRQHATSPNVTGGAASSRNLSPISRNFVVLLTAALVSLWPLTTRA